MGRDTDSWSRVTSQKFGAPINVATFIDGTHLPLRRAVGPFALQKHYYNGHKAQHTLAYLGVVSPDGILRLFWGPAHHHG